MVAQSARAADNALLIETDLGDGVIHLELNRPASRNAFSADLYNALSDALQKHSSSSEPTGARILVLSGRGPSFCAGMDLKEATSSSKHSRAVRRFMHVLSTCRKFVVAAVHGNCIGIGATLLMHCDYVFGVAQGTKLATPFRALGIVPEFASSVLFPQRLGHRLATKMLYEGLTVSGEDWYTSGAIYELVDGDGIAVQSRALAFARTLAKSAATEDEWMAVLLARESIKARNSVQIADAINAEMEQVDRVWALGIPHRLIAAKLKGFLQPRSQL